MNDRAGTLIIHNKTTIATISCKNRTVKKNSYAFLPAGASNLKQLAKPMSIQLNIDKPCHENWYNMQPNKDGRHCMSCQKPVVDFSNMTDREILDYISDINGDICGRTDRMQLNRELRENNLRKRFSWRYIW